MSRLVVICEGQTEQDFVKLVLAPHYSLHGIDLFATRPGDPDRLRSGIAAWEVFRNEALRHAAAKSFPHVAILVDYYKMPDQWPGKTDSRSLAVGNRGLNVEQALRQDLDSKLGRRFLPCVAMHEFESLFVRGA